MLPDRVSNPGPLTYESGALPIALRGPATMYGQVHTYYKVMTPCLLMTKNKEVQAKSHFSTLTTTNSYAEI